MSYAIKKNALKNEIILNYENIFYKGISWAELSVIKNKVYKLAQKYGLIRDFKENGII